MKLNEKLNTETILRVQMKRDQHAFESIENCHLKSMRGRA